MKMQPIGNGKVLYSNLNYVITLDQAIQLLRDEDKRLNERTMHQAYNGE